MHETPTVSSVQMECTWVPNITEVKMRNRRASKHKRMRRITVVGGEKELHSVKTKQPSWKWRDWVTQQLQNTCYATGFAY